MRIDRSHTLWGIFVVLATVAATLLYLANFFPHSLPFSLRLPLFLGEAPPSHHTYGGTPLGIIFGSVAFLIFLFASALGIRKKKRLWPIGSVQFWLRAHVWLTIFTIPLVLFHCGFHSGGTHTTWLMVLYVIVMGSGFFGLALQQFMPRLMSELLPREVVFEQIPYLRNLLPEAAKKLRDDITKSLPVTTAATASPLQPAAPGPEDPSAQVLVRFLERECIPYLEARRGESHLLGNSGLAINIFSKLTLNVDEPWKPRVERMQEWCNDRRLMDLQTKLQHWLHGWLLIHVPASFALLVFTAWHACVAVRFLVLG